MLTCKALYEMSQIDIDKVDKSTLADIRNITISQEVSHSKKIERFLYEMENPYCFLSGDVPVRMRFVDKSRTLSTALISYFSQLKQQ